MKPKGLPGVGPSISLVISDIWDSSFSSCFGAQQPPFSLRRAKNTYLFRCLFERFELLGRWDLILQLHLQLTEQVVVLEYVKSALLVHDFGKM